MVAVLSVSSDFSAPLDSRCRKTIAVSVTIDTGRVEKFTVIQD